MSFRINLLLRAQQFIGFYLKIKKNLYHFVLHRQKHICSTTFWIFHLLLLINLPSNNVNNLFFFPPTLSSHDVYIILCDGKAIIFFFSKLIQNHVNERYEDVFVLFTLIKQSMKREPFVFTTKAIRYYVFAKAHSQYVSIDFLFEEILPEMLMNLHRNLFNSIWPETNMVPLQKKTFWWHFWHIIINILKDALLMSAAYSCV